MVTLYARLYKRPSLNKTIALGVSVSESDWLHIDSVLQSAAQAQKMGGAVVLRDSLASKLWEIRTKLDAMIVADIATPESARRAIDAILRENIIREAQQQIEEQQQKEELDSRMTLIKWIETYISQCMSGERLKRKSAKMVTYGTIKTYRATLAQLKAYQENRHKVVDFDDVTLSFYDDWRRFLLEKKDKAGHPHPYSANTIGKHIKNLKIFLYAAKDMKLTTCNDFTSASFSADSVDVENVYLTDERVQEMYQTDFEDEATRNRLLALAPSEEERTFMKDQIARRTPTKLNQAKDVFVVGCLTGQRVSDYKRINEEMIRTLDDGNDYIYLNQTKTGKWIYIPLDVRVRAILVKYGGRLPKMYDQDLNDRIKIVGRLLGWRENAGIAELHGTMSVLTTKKFYECIKTHTARRTFATNAYKRHISLSAIMIITGHSSEAMLKKYLKLDGEERAMMAAAEFASAKEVQLKLAE